MMDVVMANLLGRFCGQSEERVREVVDALDLVLALGVGLQYSKTSRQRTMKTHHFPSWSDMAKE